MASRGREQDLVLALETAECIAISEESLRKIVMELLDNACKFSQPGTHIAVRTETGPKHYLISVEDKGRGMTEEQIAQVGAYNQFDRPLYEDQGSGLGLVICKRLAELAGGSLSIQSERGAGTVVIVQIPVRAYPE
jgi:signal transduction histidine kinase